MVRGKKESKDSMVQSLDAKESLVCNSMDNWDWQRICFALEWILYIVLFHSPLPHSVLIHSIYLSRMKAPGVQEPCSLTHSSIPDSRTILACITCSVQIYVDLRNGF